MRTTVTLPEDILRAAKERAHERQTTVSEVVVDALRVALSAPSPAKRRRFKLVTFRGKGIRPGIDLDRSSALLEAEDLEAFGKVRR